MRFALVKLFKTKVGSLSLFCFEKLRFFKLFKNIDHALIKNGVNIIGRDDVKGKLALPFRS